MAGLPSGSTRFLSVFLPYYIRYFLGKNGQFDQLNFGFDVLFRQLGGSKHNSSFLISKPYGVFCGKTDEVYVALAQFLKRYGAREKYIGGQYLRYSTPSKFPSCILSVSGKGV